MKKRIFSLLLALCLVAGMLPTVAYAYDNTGTIDSGEFNEDVNNRGTINGGTFNNAVTNSGTINNGEFNNTVTNTPGSSINNGAFNGIVNNYGGGKITGGTFNNTVNNGSASDYILGGTFYGTVNNNGGAKIQGGVFNGTVNNTGTAKIQNGTFYSTVNNYADNDINSGTFYGDVENNGTITGGTFYGAVSGTGTIRDSAKVTVTFDSDNGNTVQEEKVLRGQKASEPTAPTKDGYIFDGWYNGSATSSYDFDTPVIENITLTAKWSVKSDVTFNTAPQSYTYNDAVQAFSITGTAVTGFDIAYKQSGQTVANPINAGSYDVIITRAEDNTYNAVDVTISNGLVIEPAAPAENPAKKTTARVVRGRTLADAAVTNGEILALDGVTPLTGTLPGLTAPKS